MVCMALPSLRSQIQFPGCTHTGKIQLEYGKIIKCLANAYKWMWEQTDEGKSPCVALTANRGSV